jgi:soluble P-type ATPase
VLEASIPGFGSLRLQHLVLDYNGTLAADGAMLPGVRRRLRALSRLLKIHVVTADTFGTARRALSNLPCTLTVLPPVAQDRAKRAYVERLGPKKTACIGNGRNDRLMLKVAALAIAVIEKEGSAASALSEADVVTRNIVDALDLLEKPRRLMASLRS